MSDMQIDVNDIINSLSEQVAALSRDNAILKAQNNALNKALAEGEDKADASDTV